MNLYDSIGQIHSKTMPPQGMTSTVTLLETDKGRFACKQADHALYVTWLQREAYVLKALEDTNLPVPRCIALATQADATTLLMTALPGEPLSTLLCRGVTKPMRLDLLEQFGRILSTIHQAPLPVILHADQSWLTRILEEARSNLRQGYAEPGAPPIEPLVAASPEPIPEVLIHGDYTIDNVLVDRGQITGIIDWGRGDIGDRRYNLALATRPQGPEGVFREEADFQAFYRGYAGERLTPAENFWFYTLYAYF